MHYSQAFIELLRKEQAKAVEQFVSDYNASLIYYASKKVANAQEAEDIAMASIEQFLEHLRTGKILVNDGRHLNNLIYRYVRNACVNSYRSHERYKEGEQAFLSLIAADTTQPDLDQQKAEVLQEIWREIGQLPQKTREAFELYLQGYNRNEIAEQLNRTENTVKNQLQNAKDILRQKFKDSDLSLLLILAFIHASAN